VPGIGRDQLGIGRVRQIGTRAWRDEERVVLALYDRRFRLMRAEGSLPLGIEGDRPLGGKTGTTNDSKDLWFIGFSPSLVVVGFDEPKSLVRTRQEPPLH